MRESQYQNHLIRRLEDEFPGCIVLKNDCGYKQGISDLTFLYYGGWALLEVKMSEDAIHQPNQDYYVDQAKGMCFGAFIYPSNEEEVFSALQHAFAGAGRATRGAQPKQSRVGQLRRR